MLQFILRRILFAFPMIIGVSIIVFSIFAFSKIDPVKRLLGEKAADPEKVAQIREAMGLDRPPLVRYWDFISGVFVGDFGKSIRTRRPVRTEILERLPASIELTFLALVLSVTWGLSAGILSAIKRNTWIDYSVMGISLLGVSMPVFWLGLMLAWFFAEKLDWLPLYGRHALIYAGAIELRTGFLSIDSILAGRPAIFWDALKHLILPAVTLTAVTSALTARMTRASVLEVLQQDFIRTARAKGVGRIRWLRHVLRNALIPVVTIIGLEIPALLGGAVITETIFSWPGLGSYLIEAIRNGDITAVQGIVMFTTLLFIGVNLLVDIMYAVIDPRIRLG